MRTLTTVSLAAIVLLLTGCEAMMKGKGAAEISIDQFHKQLNDGKFDDIWNQAGDTFRSAAPKDKFDKLMAAIQRKLGPVKSSVNAGFNVRTFNTSTTVSMTQDTQFEKGKGTESFTFEMDGDHAVLIGYNLQSMDMMTQ